MKTYRIRLFLLCFLTLMMFGIILIRLYYLQIICHTSYEKLARQQQNMQVQLIPRRGDITDCKGIILATSHMSYNIILDTSKFKEAPPAAMVHDLAQTLERSDAWLLEFFKRPRRHILVRKAPDELSKKIEKSIVLYQRDYDIPPEALILEQNSERENPNNNLACHIIGYTNIDGMGDNIGKTGVEAKYNEFLKGALTRQAVPVNQLRKELAPLKEETIEATYGKNVVLTIDQRIQMFTEKALQAQVGNYQALGGIAIVLDVTNGEILALASCPDFDLNKYNKSDPAQLRNRTLTDPIEIGSVMKILTATLLLDKGLLSPDEEINCQHMHGIVDGRKFTDTHDLGFVPFRQAFAASSNIALATVGLRLEPATYYDGLFNFGLGQQTGVDLPGEGCGILYPLERWTRQSRTSLPIGYECSMTAMEVISALGAIGNDGLRLRPHLVKEVRTRKGELVKRFDQEPPLSRVASPKTCRTVRELMAGVMEMPMGTGFKLPKLPGYRIGGKTGTSVKTPPGVTPKKYIASFAGILPIDKPRLAIYVYVDEPRGEEFYGGTVAAPVFRQIALQATHILGIPPDDPAAYPLLEKELAGGLTSRTLAMTSQTLPMDFVEPDNQPLPADAVAELASPEDNLLPRMPDCMGKTIPEAWKTLSDAGITSGVRTLGSGLVVRQEPSPDAPIRPNRGVTLIFALPSESAKTIGTPEPKRAE